MALSAPLERLLEPGELRLREKDLEHDVIDKRRAVPETGNLSWSHMRATCERIVIEFCPVLKRIFCEAKQNCATTLYQRVPVQAARTLRWFEGTARAETQWRP